MPTLQYPKNPNTDTAFVVQDDGTKNRALMIAPQDISTLELPSNPNSTKGYVTVDGKKQRVILVADVTGGGGDQHNMGYYTDPTALQTAHPTGTDGDYAILGSTDTIWVWDSGTSAWVDSDQKGQVTSVNNKTGDVVLTPSDIGATSMSVPTAPTLAVADWSSNTQTVTVTGVTASNTVIVSPAPASAVEYAACGILCTTQGTDSLTFTCTAVPANALTVNVVILS